MSDLYIFWSEYHQKIEQLAVKLYQTNWDFNQIVCIAKGGLRVGDTLAAYVSNCHCLLKKRLLLINPLNHTKG